MSRIEKCPDCPIAGRCIVQSTAHVAFCDWAASGDERRIARIVALSAEHADDPMDAPEPPDRPSAREAIALIEAMKACPDRVVDSECGCSGAKCRRRNLAMVSHIDCFACLRGE